jgi:hypothetical protein
LPETIAPIDGGIDSYWGSGTVAVGQIIEIERGLAPLPRQHALAPKSEQYIYYHRYLTLRQSLRPLIGRVVSTPRLLLHGQPLQEGTSSVDAQFDNYIIQPMHTAGPVPAYVLPANPGILMAAGQYYQEVRHEPRILVP